MNKYRQARDLCHFTDASVYSTPVPTEGENNGDDCVGWTTVMRKSHHGSPAKDSHQELLTKKSHCESQTKESVSKCQLRPEQERTMQEAINQLTKDQQRKIYKRQHVISVTGVKKPGTKSTLS